MSYIKSLTILFTELLKMYTFSKSLILFTYNFLHILYTNTIKDLYTLVLFHNNGNQRLIFLPADKIEV